MNAKGTSMTWKNVGDVSPLNGILLYRAPEISDGDFTAEAIETISETNMGGDECRFLVRAGTVHLSAANFSSALATVGAKLEGDMIIRAGHHDGEERLPISSEEGLRELLIAAHGLGGIDNVDIETLVQIGEDSAYDLPKKFGEDPTIYSGDANLWAVVAREAEVPDLPQAQGAPAADPVDIDEVLSL